LELIYKYYGFEAGIEALKRKTLGFNTPTKFNDPMEGRLWLHQMGVQGDFLNTYLENIGILCLTENPMNPLMWSHYGQSHTGFVIGYDINEPIFRQQADCVFDVTEGEIFYSPEFNTTTPEDDSLQALQWLCFGMNEPRTPQIEQTLRHIFLMKQNCWSYEEEIRVIKILGNFGEEQQDWVSATGNNFQTISTPISPMTSLSMNGLRLLNVSSGSIKRIILGMRNPLLKDNTNVIVDDDVKSIVEMPETRIEKTTWTEGGHSLTSVDAGVIKWGHPEKVQTKTLDDTELQVILKKSPEANVDKQGLTLTKYPSGKTEAFWDSEL
jgi:hypothetical protein